MSISNAVLKCSPSCKISACSAGVYCVTLLSDKSNSLRSSTIDVHQFVSHTHIQIEPVESRPADSNRRDVDGLSFFSSMPAFVPLLLKRSIGACHYDMA